MSDSSTDIILKYLQNAFTDDHLTSSTQAYQAYLQILAYYWQLHPDGYVHYKTITSCPPIGQCSSYTPPPTAYLIDLIYYAAPVIAQTSFQMIWADHIAVARETLPASISAELEPHLKTIESTAGAMPSLNPSSPKAIKVADFPSYYYQTFQNSVTLLSNYTRPAFAGIQEIIKKHLPSDAANALDASGKPKPTPHHKPNPPKPPPKPPHHKPKPKENCPIPEVYEAFFKVMNMKTGTLNPANLTNMLNMYIPTAKAGVALPTPIAVSNFSPPMFMATAYVEKLKHFAPTVEGSLDPFLQLAITTFNESITAIPSNADGNGDYPSAMTYGDIYNKFSATVAALPNVPKAVDGLRTAYNHICPNPPTT